MVKNRLLQRLKGIQFGAPLGQQFYRFLAVHTSFLLFTSLPSVFINTFLMGQSDSMDVVMYYNAMSFYATALGMFLSAGILHHTNSGTVSLIGIIGYNLLYLQLILFSTHAADYVFLLGATNGLAGSFYWMSYSQRLTDNTTLINRDSGVAILNIFASLVNLTVPLLSGTLISSIGGTNGYLIVFGLAFIIAIVTAINSIRLPKPEGLVRSNAKYRESFRLLFRHKPIHTMFWAELIRGLREGIFGFILNILLYQLIRNEALIGFNTLLSGAASIISFIIITRVVTVKNRVKSMAIALGVLTTFGICTVFAMNSVVLVLFTIVNSLFIGFIANASSVTVLDAIQVVPGAMEKRPELFAIKEVFLATGRCLGIFVLLIAGRFTGGDLFWQALCLLFLTATQLAVLFLCKRALIQMKAYQES